MTVELRWANGQRGTTHIPEVVPMLRLLTGKENFAEDWSFPYGDWQSVEFDLISSEPPIYQERVAEAA